VNEERNMEWGIQTLIEAPSPEDSASLCRELGFDFVELSMDLPDYQSFDIPRLRKAAEKYGIYYTIHLEGLMDLCGFNSRVADAYLQTLVDTIEAAKQLGVPNLNMHLPRGDYFTLPDQKIYLYERYNDHFRMRIDRAIAQCEKAVGDADLRICIENTNGFTPDYLREGVEMFLRSPLFGLTYDIGHDHGAGEVDKPFFLAHQDKLRHFHIHDAIGGKNHMALGAGELDLAWYIFLAKKNHCRAVLEVKTAQALRESVGWLEEHQFI